MLKNIKDKGFTLIEVIISLVILSVFAGMYAPYFKTWVAKSVEPIQVVQSANQLRQAMENITQAYMENSSDMTALAALSKAVGAKGTSQDNDFGKYTVVNNNFIDFDASGNMTAATTKNRLRISITDSSGASFTVVFSME